jgi:ribosomal protein S18 acetylase RimI-like enzyme
MVLTVLPKDDVLRAFGHSRLAWLAELGEQETLAMGTALSSPAFGRVWDANGIRDAALAQGMSPADAMAAAHAHLAQRGVVCFTWTMNPAVPAAATRPLVEHLLSLGYHEQEELILRLSSAPPARPAAQGLMILPARAAFGPMREIAQQAVAHWNEPQLVEAAMARLDNPHWDVLLGLWDRRPVATAGLLTVGDLGLVEDVFVAPDFRGRGFGRALLSAALEIAARAALGHVLLSVTSDNAPAMNLYAGLGFVAAGVSRTYYRPECVLTPASQTAAPRQAAAGGS